MGRWRTTMVRVGMAALGFAAFGLTSPATASSSTTTTNPDLTASSTTSTTSPGAAGNLACAERIVSAWPLVDVARETVVVSVQASQLASMGPAEVDGYGGLLLFGLDAPPHMAALMTRLQAQSLHGYPLLVMTDEEGGGVQRLTNVVGSFPWAQTMGETMTATQIEAIGARVGRELLSAGVNVDLAPVLDVDGRDVQPGPTDPDGLRSFSGSPDVAATDGVAFMSGLAQAGVTSVVKHFPGLGGATANTDDGPASTRSWVTLQTTGLVPFERAIGAGVAAVMMSNASIPGLTSLPASLSSAAVGALRQQLGFHGLIVTDSLTAGAIGARHLGAPGAAVQAIAAGVDLILAGSPSTAAASLTLAHQVSASLFAAVVHGTLARTTLVDAAAQVLATRNTLTCP